MHPWPAQSQCPDVAIRKIPAAWREGRAALVVVVVVVGEGGSASGSLGCAPASTFPLGSGPSESSTWEEERPWALLCSSTIPVPPLAPATAYLLPLPSRLYFWSISLEMYASLSTKLQVLLSPPSPACKAGVVGGW